ncbi:hypothetical protein [Streptomyces sp. NPDC057301]|uniref:hypothetical protein n=1 Tax=Streptomyces sp. NPDC057301 TaxID=3346093 RepID=UPI0036331ECB
MTVMWWVPAGSSSQGFSAWTVTGSPSSTLTRSGSTTPRRCSAAGVGEWTVRE